MQIGTLVRICYTTDCGVGIIIETDTDEENNEPLYLVHFVDGIDEWYYDNGELEVLCK